MIHQTHLSRRSALGLAAAAGVAGSAGSLLSPSTAQACGRQPHSFGYGPLIADPDGLLDLPRGFSYRVVAVANGTPLKSTTLTDGGEKSPSRYDGTGCFRSQGGPGYVLVTNHENGTSAVQPVPHRSGLTYDAGSAFGGTTTLTTDKYGRRLTEVVSLAGTLSNCAGGVTPWGTWLTCEENESKAGGGLQKDHGYVFEVDPHDVSANRDPKPIKAFGRFPHEAVVVDPHSGHVYLTEDANGPHGLLYHWAPEGRAPKGRKSRHTDFRALDDTAGTLTAMYCTDDGTFVPDLSVANKLGTTYSVTWKEVPDRDAQKASTRKQFDQGKPITRSRKLEGMWWGDGGFYFDASFARTGDGSEAEHDGQVWFLDVDASTITLVVYWPVREDVDTQPDSPDNITVNPHGGLMICEDGEGVNHLVLDDLDGNYAFFARNNLDSEMAGATFSDNGQVLFANSQDPGVVFAITGPWRRS